MRSDVVKQAATSARNSAKAPVPKAGLAKVSGKAAGKAPAKSAAKPSVKGKMSDKVKQATVAKAPAKKIVAKPAPAKPAAKAAAKPVLPKAAPAAKAPAKPVAAKAAAAVAPAKTAAAKPVTPKANDNKVPAAKAAAPVAAKVTAPVAAKPAAPVAAVAAPAAKPANTNAPRGGGQPPRMNSHQQKAPVVAAKPVDIAKVRAEFQVGAAVVYPTHGVGKIVSLDRTTIGDDVLELLVVQFERDKMIVRIPLQKVTSNGMRRLSSPQKLKTALETLKGRARIKRAMWSRRAQEYEAKINSGDPIQIAEVVRDLHRTAGQPDQSYSERQIYERALERLSNELAAVENIDDDSASQRLEKVLKAA